MKWFTLLRKGAEFLAGVADWAESVDARLARLERSGVPAPAAAEPPSAEPVSTEITLDPATWPEREVEHGGLRDREPESVTVQVTELDERIILLAREACDRLDSGADWNTLRGKIMRIRRLHTTQIGGVVASARARGRLPPNGNAKAERAPKPPPAPAAPPEVETVPSPPSAVPSEPEPPRAPPPPVELEPRRPHRRVVRPPPAAPPPEPPPAAPPAGDVDPADPSTWPQREVKSGREDIPPNEVEYEVDQADIARIVESYKAPGSWPKKSRIIGAKLRYTRAQVQGVIDAARASGDLPPA